MKAFRRLMHDPMPARILLRGKLRDEDDGSWIWCAIIEEDWFQLVPALYSEVGVFELPNEPQKHLQQGPARADPAHSHPLFDTPSDPVISLNNVRVTRVTSLTRAYFL